jgi:hypothetical protein
LRYRFLLVAWWHARTVRPDPSTLGVVEERGSHHEGLVELRRRLASARWPSKELVGDQSRGVQLATLQALARY